MEGAREVAKLVCCLGQNSFCTCIAVGRRRTYKWHQCRNALAAHADWTHHAFAEV